MRVTFLGTGTSVGVPRIACDCPVCSSTQPENKRLRCSILIEHGDRHILVDTSPDLRTQALTYRVDRVDAVLFTHGHADHLHGLDDVRIYCFQREMGKSHVFAADPKKYRELATNTLDAGCMASPAVTNGLLILRTKTHLYGIGE